MLYVNATRVEILSHLPKGMRVAEIGAQAGEYATNLLKHLEPRELHLIDPWIYHADEYYRHDPANVPQELQDRLYNQVRSRFADHIGTGRVKLHRAKSLEIVSHFPNDFFDMVYVDAMHYHDAVLNDLIAYAPKIRPGGILCGHDFCDHQLAAAMSFGVVSAVGTFIKRSAWDFDVISGKEDFPSYFLTDGRGEDWINHLVKSAFLNYVDCIELPNSLAPNFKAKLIVDADGKRWRLLSSFA